MKNILSNIVLVASLSTFTLVGCSTNTQKENTTIGAITGAVAGGIAGSFIGQGTGKAVAIGLGAIAGGLLGGVIGHNMDSSDCNNMNTALNNNYKDKTSSWHNKRTNVSYRVTPTSDVMTYNGYDHCRRFQTDAVINGELQTTNGVACRVSDGSWKTIS